MSFFSESPLPIPASDLVYWLIAQRLSRKVNLNANIKLFVEFFKIANQSHNDNIATLNFQANNFHRNFLFDTQITYSLYSGPSELDAK